jgi:hypothetical protein
MVLSLQAEGVSSDDPLTTLAGGIRERGVSLDNTHPVASPAANATSAAAAVTRVMLIRAGTADDVDNSAIDHYTVMNPPQPLDPSFPCIPVAPYYEQVPWLWLCSSEPCLQLGAACIYSSHCRMVGVAD